MYERKRTKPFFFANRTAKIRTLCITLQNFSEFFLLLSSRAISLFHYVNLSRLSSLGKRVQKYALFIYTPNIICCFFYLFFKEMAKALKKNDVVEHISLRRRDCGRKRGRDNTLLYHMRARGSTQREKKKKTSKNEMAEITIEQRWQKKAKKINRRKVRKRAEKDSRKRKLQEKRY